MNSSMDSACCFLGNEPYLLRGIRPVDLSALGLSVPLKEETLFYIRAEHSDCHVMVPLTCLVSDGRLHFFHSFSDSIRTCLVGTRKDMVCAVCCCCCPPSSVMRGRTTHGAALCLQRHCPDLEPGCGLVRSRGWGWGWNGEDNFLVPRLVPGLCPLWQHSGPLGLEKNLLILVLL